MGFHAANKIKTLKMMSLLCFFILITTANAECLNDRSFSYDDPKQTCVWVRWKEERRREFCVIEEVNIKCPQSCGMCCEDDASYTFENNSGEVRDCAWVKESGTDGLYCDKFKGGRMVRDACPLTCRYCKSKIDLPPIISGAERGQPNNGSDDTKHIGMVLVGVALVASLAMVAIHYNRKDEKRAAVTSIQDISTMSSEADMEEGSMEKYNANGVSIFWIKHQLPQKVKEYGLDLTATLYEVENLYSQHKGVLRKIGEHQICPRDGKLGAAVVDSIEGEDYIGPVSFILNHSWSYSIGDIIDTLWDHCFYNNLDPKRSYVWAGFLCSNLNRFVEEGEGRSLEMYQELHEPLHTRIYSIGNVLAMVSPWREPVHLRNAWGLFDIFTAIDAGCSLIAVMTPGEKKKLIMEALQHESQLLDMFDAIDQAEIATAETVQPEDKEYIMDMIKESPGVEKVNEDVNRMLRGWAKEEIRKALKYHEGRSKDASIDEGFALMCLKVGNVLSRVDESTDALALFKKALVIHTNIYGAKHEKTVRMHARVVMELKASGDLKGAREELKHAFELTKTESSINFATAKKKSPSSTLMKKKHRMRRPNQKFSRVTPFR